MQSCPICFCTEWKRKHKVQKYNVLQCTKCALQMLDPQPSQAILEGIYSDYYHAWDQSGKDAVTRMKQGTFKGYLNKISRFHNSGKLLDVGCARGELLTVAQNTGFEPYGVEVAPDGVRVSEDLFGSEKISGKSLRDSNFETNFFDVITLCDVLEHIEDPNELSNDIKRILKPSGILLIVTPDTSSWSRKLLGANWPHYKEEHLYYYNRKNLTEFLKSDYEILMVTSARKTLSLDYVINILKRDEKPLFHAASRLLNLFSAFNKVPFEINFGEMLLICKKK